MKYILFSLLFTAILTSCSPKKEPVVVQEPNATIEYTESEITDLPEYEKTTIIYQDNKYDATPYIMKKDHYNSLISSSFLVDKLDYVEIENDMGEDSESWIVYKELGSDKEIMFEINGKNMIINGEVMRNKENAEYNKETGELAIPISSLARIFGVSSSDFYVVGNTLNANFNG
jgi:hypothetical protein